MSLGDKLKKIKTELEEARIKKINAQHEADLNKIRRRKAQRENLVTRIMERIKEQIDSEKVPRIRIDSFEEKQWIEAAEEGEAEFQELWSQLIRDLGQEKLLLEVLHEHDGIGMKSWIIITVNPSDYKITYRSDGTRESIPGEIEMDPRPQADARIRQAIREKT